MQVVAAKKREASALQSAKSEKYARRAEVEALLAAREAPAAEGAAKRRRVDEQPRDVEAAAGASRLDEDQQQRQQQQQQQQQQQLEQQEQPLLAWPDLRRRLRELGEPATLFGEDLEARMARLRRAELDAATKREDGLEGGHDIRNRFVGGDEERGDAARKDAGEDADESKEQEDETDEADEDKVIYRFFKSMLQRWEKDLANRPDHIKRTAQGKIATKTMKQCKDYIRPLFKLCKRRQVPEDIRPNLVEIVRHCREGEFVRANDAYIRLAIGNAAWPIGVTMVGIHERTGREKINANKQAHVMNNESQRKYLTSVKRLISYAQSVSNVLPSKKVS